MSANHLVFKIPIYLSSSFKIFLKKLKIVGDFTTCVRIAWPITFDSDFFTTNAYQIFC